MGVDLQSIRSRLSGLRESLTSTTRSLKGRWGAGHHAAGNHHRCALCVTLEGRGLYVPEVLRPTFG